MCFLEQCNGFIKIILSSYSKSFEEFFHLEPYCHMKLYYYALTIKHTEFSTSPVHIAEMIRSDHTTAEISHFLNKWFQSIELFSDNE